MEREVYATEEVAAMSDEDVGALCMTGRTFEEEKALLQEFGLWIEESTHEFAFIGAAFKQFEGTLHKPEIAEGISEVCFYEGSQDKQGPYESAVKKVSGILKKLRQGREVTDALRWTLELPLDAAGDVARYVQPFIREMERRGYTIIEVDDSLTAPNPKKGAYRAVAFNLRKEGQTLVRELLMLQPHMLAAKAEMHDFNPILQKVERALKNPRLPADKRQYLGVLIEYVKKRQDMSYTLAWRMDNPSARFW